jgi:xylan 1,4-beta-xylosidase
MRRGLAILILCLTASAASAQQRIRIQVNASETSGPIKPVWAWIGHDEPNFTYSDEGRHLLTTLSRMGPVRYHDRTHNLLTSGDGTPSLKWGSTNVYTLDSNGKPVYDWAIIDKIFDTYRAAGIVPFVEIGFMPKALSTHPEPYRHHWPKGPLFTGWSYPPKSYEAWSELVFQFVKHMVDRYGAHDVESWEWEVWNEPDIPYWHGSFDEYCKLYDFTAAGVKRALPSARVGGPASTSPQSPRAAQFLRDFLTHCISGKNYATSQTGAPLDFISFHAKGRTQFLKGHVEMDLGRQLRDIDSGFRIVASFATLRKLPVVISESDPETCAACSATIHPEMGYRFTSQYGSYEAELLYETLVLAKHYDINLQGAVTWAFVFPGQPYFAGFRAFETHGIELPLMNAFWVFGRLTGERVAAQSSGAHGTEQILQSSVRAAPDVGALAARDGKTLNVLVWNYDDDARPSAPAEINLTVAGLPPGVKRVSVRRFDVDQDHGNPYAVWLAMDSPQAPSPAQYRKLKAAATIRPEPPNQLKVKETSFELDFSVASQGVSLLKFKW